MYLKFIIENRKYVFFAENFPLLQWARVFFYVLHDHIFHNNHEQLLSLTNLQIRMLSSLSRFEENPIL